MDIIQMTSNYSIIDVEEESNRERKCQLINTLSIYTTLYNTYSLLYCKGNNSDDK